METKKALKAHMAKGKGAHPDPMAKKLKTGGVTSMMEKKMGRNMARATVQKNAGRGR